MDEVTEIVDVTVPAITTDAAIINQGNAPALEDAANSNTGAYNSFDANAPLGILPANSAALPRVSRAAYVEKYYGEDRDSDVDFWDDVEFSIMLEVQLLPNFQENDRLNY